MKYRYNINIFISIILNFNNLIFIFLVIFKIEIKISKNIQLIKKKLNKYWFLVILIINIIFFINIYKDLKSWYKL